MMNFKRLLHPLFILVVPFCILLFILVILLFRLPEIAEWVFLKFLFRRDQQEFFKIPRDLHDLKLLGAALLKYKCICYWRILLTITVVYIFLQSFMIPGSVFCSFLLGYLFPIPLALFVIAFCSAVGASCCYVIFDFIGGNIMLNLFPERIAACQQMMSRFKSTMCLTIFLFRLSPIIPNWLINISSPLLGVPLVDFFVGTFIGVIPLSLFFVKAGTMLQELTDIGVTSVASVYTLALFAVISIVPIIFRNQIESFLSG
ncbi:unnamed protein product [Hydatigera taeniaeformis]|uniref:SNARE associated Golgi protein n=1 Tax=Hydatigena taeniaeformis TaxID=6205 RepID=A0A0R3WRW4_HYDTA|nr:unnamed protein product [Hydatigera taeniaeformis]